LQQLLLNLRQLVCYLWVAGCFFIGFAENGDFNAHFWLMFFMNWFTFHESASIGVVFFRGAWSFTVQVIFMAAAVARDVQGNVTALSSVASMKCFFCGLGI
jgi:hypothetical protein